MPDITNSVHYFIEDTNLHIVYTENSRACPSQVIWVSPCWCINCTFKRPFVPLSGWQLLANTVFNKTSRFDGYVATIVGNILATYCSYRKVNSMSLIQWIDTMFCRMLRWTRSLWIILQLNMGELTYSWVKIIPLSISCACKLLLILSEKNGKEYLPDHWSSSTKYLKLC